MEMLFVVFLATLLDPGLQLRVQKPDSIPDKHRHENLGLQSPPSHAVLDKDGLHLPALQINYQTHQFSTPKSDSDNLKDSLASAHSSENAALHNVTGTKTTTLDHGETLLGRRYQSPYSIGELLNLVIPSKSSPDIDMDPCKAGYFIGDIAFPQNITKSSKQSSKVDEHFDVRDTMSEARVGTGDHISHQKGSSRKGKTMRQNQPRLPALSEKNIEWLEKIEEKNTNSEFKTANSLKKDPKQSDKAVLLRSPHPSLRPYTPGHGYPFFLHPKVHPEDRLILEKSNPQRQKQPKSEPLKQLKPKKEQQKPQQEQLKQLYLEKEQLKKLNPEKEQLKKHKPQQGQLKPQQEQLKQLKPKKEQLKQHKPQQEQLKLYKPHQEQLKQQQTIIDIFSPNQLIQLKPQQQPLKQLRQDKHLKKKQHKINRRLGGSKFRHRGSKLRRNRGSKGGRRRRGERRRRRLLRKRRRMLKKEKGMKKLLVGEKNKKMDVREKEGKEKKMETEIWTESGGIKTAVWKEKEHVEGKENKTAIWKEKVQVSGMEKRREKRAATARPERIWDYAVIPYEIDSNFSGVHKALFKQAMRHWENYTCIQFVERTAEHPNWIVFTERPCGCCSFVGKRGNGPQAISIGKNCDKFGIVVHELGHVVGFWHEHTRPDRDHWVTIIRENVILGQDYNFNELTPEEVNSLGFRYDYDSIMHYARNTFSKGTYLDTILPRSDLPENQEAMPEIGQRIRLSSGDILQTSALYNCAACGKTYQDTAGKFGSPQFPVYVPPHGSKASTFKKGDLCQWRILATHGEKIILNITTLDIPPSANCQLDYLEVRDGYWHKSALLARLCGSTTPQSIISSGSRLMVTYKTHEHSPDHKGFRAQYEAVCGGELDTESGQLESPNFPEDYQPNKECIWKISVSADFQVALKFQSFEIENHDNCVYDYLEIRDGSSSSSPLIGTYCGYKMPKDIKSSTNSLWIKFVSDGSVQKAGFSASFMKEYDECQSPDHGCEHECINTLGGYQCMCRLGYELHSDDRRCENACGGLIDTSNGTITSPSFPDIYPSNKNCIWEIIAPPQWRITINFTHFDIEGNNQDCEYDSLAISSKMGSGEARQHGLFCGNRLPPVITSEGNSLRLEFLSDNSVQKNGFAAIFFTDKDECATDNGGCQHVCRNTIGAYYCSCHQGFVLHENGHDCKEGGCKHEITTNKGEISSPHYPDYYPAKKECVWIFSTTAGHRIKLLFTEFELEPHQECAYDHIVVYDGHTTSQQILGRFCGSKLPHPLITTDSSMLLVFKSDASVQRKGFMAEHMTVCGGHLEAAESKNKIFSHAKFGDINYENKEDCDWIIEAPQGRHVHLRFDTFQLEEEQDCGYDFIEVFSGYDDSGPSYGRFCGNKIPPEIISVDESLLLRFKSDDTINSKGFSASYVIIDQAENKDYDEIYVEQKQ